jgi:DNA-directed RNA polymerase alpha subunit
MSDSDLLKIRNFGEKSLHELQDKLTELGVGSNNSEESDNQEEALVAEEVEE